MKHASKRSMLFYYTILYNNVEYLLQRGFNVYSIKESPHSCLWSS